MAITPRDVVLSAETDECGSSDGGRERDSNASAGTRDDSVDAPAPAAARRRWRKRFVALGANAFALLYEENGRKSGREMVERVLDGAKTSGANVLRVWAFLD